MVVESACELPVLLPDPFRFQLNILNPDPDPDVDDESIGIGAGEIGGCW